MKISAGGWMSYLPAFLSCLPEVEMELNCRENRGMLILLYIYGNTIFNGTPMFCFWMFHSCLTCFACNGIIKLMMK